jgi:hypothetical protein
MLTLYVRDLTTRDYLDTIVIASIEDAEFDVESYVVEPGKSYMVDFYADHNGNGSYDAPPADHAWRLETTASAGDLELEFVHNTNFTDIFNTTGIRKMNNELMGISIYPNPAQNHAYIESEVEIASVVLYDIKGSQVKYLEGIQSSLVYLNLEGIHPGVYFVKIRSVDHQTKISRLVKQ